MGLTLHWWVWFASLSWAASAWMNILLLQESGVPHDMIFPSMHRPGALFAASFTSLSWWLEATSKIFTPNQYGVHSPLISQIWHICKQRGVLWLLSLVFFPSLQCSSNRHSHSWSCIRESVHHSLVLVQTSVSGFDVTDWLSKGMNIISIYLKYSRCGLITALHKCKVLMIFTLSYNQRLLRQIQKQMFLYTLPKIL